MGGWGDGGRVRPEIPIPAAGLAQAVGDPCPIGPVRLALPARTHTALPDGLVLILDGATLRGGYKVGR
jgi:hypothetical protein